MSLVRAQQGEPLKPLKTLCFQGFSVISEALKGLQKIQILRFRNLHTRMTVNQAGNRRKDHPALTTTCLQSSAFQGNFLWFGGGFIEQIWAALEIPFRRRKWMYSILLWTDRWDSRLSYWPLISPLQAGSREVWIPCRENIFEAKMDRHIPNTRTWKQSVIYTFASFYIFLYNTDEEKARC